MFKTLRNHLFAPLAAMLLLLGVMGPAMAKGGTALKIGYSDWPGWVAWDIGVQKGWFEEAGVSVEFVWYDSYVDSMDAFSAEEIDAVCMTNIDALVTSALSGRLAKGILVNDYSNGNDMIVTGPDIASVKDLKGKKIGLEVGLLEQLLVQKALEKNGLTESDITIVNVPTHKTPLALKNNEVAAIAAWQPHSGQAKKTTPGAKVLFSSADAPGLIYDMLFVEDKNLAANIKEWKKVVQVWFRIAGHMKEKGNSAEVLSIMSRRVKMSPEEYAPLLGGTFILDLPANRRVFGKNEGLTSIYGSCKAADKFNVRSMAYETPLDVGKHIYPDIVNNLP